MTPIFCSATPQNSSSASLTTWDETKFNISSAKSDLFPTTFYILSTACNIFLWNLTGCLKKLSFTELSICRFAMNIISISSQLAAASLNAQFGKTLFFETLCIHIEHLNIARIAKAVHVTLWLSITNGKWKLPLPNKCVTLTGKWIKINKISIK